MHRKGKTSQYTWENVAIVPGGRAGLIRIAAILNNAYVGFFIPDYTGTYTRPWICNPSLIRWQHTTRCSRCSRTYDFVIPTSSNPR
jgi:hypothetical protein